MANPLPTAPTQLGSDNSSAEAGKRFALLVAGVVVIFFAAENLHRIKSLPRKMFCDRRQVAAWTVFLILTYAGYIYQPEADDPSVVITFGAGIQLFALCLLYAMPRKAAPAGATRTGDSAEFALLLAVSFGLRLSSTCRFLGYLPTDATGDGCYQALEALSMLLALRGLCSTGLAPDQGLRCVLVVVASGLFSLACYGDLDRRPVWDRVYATSNYVELGAWLFMSSALLRAGADRTVPSPFLLPAVAQAYLRAGFWFLAVEEMVPQRPTRLMEYFPTVLVALHATIAVALTMVALLLMCKPTLSVLPTSEVKAQAEPFMDFVAQVLSAGPGPGAPSGLVPVRAVYEDGKLRVEYAPAGGAAAKGEQAQEGTQLSFA